MQTDGSILKLLLGGGWACFALEAIEVVGDGP